MKHKILVALDGSDESLVTAWLLKKQGHSIRAVLFDVSEKSELKEQLVQHVHDFERKLGVPVQLMDCGKEVRDIVSKEISFEQARGNRYDLKAIFDQKFLFPKLFAMKAHFQFDKIATGHRVNLQFEPLENLMKVVRYQPKNEDESALILGLSQQQLQSLEFPLGSIPMSMIQKLASELQLGGGITPVKFELPNDSDESVENIDATEAAENNVADDLSLMVETFNPSVIFGGPVEATAITPAVLKNREIKEVWLENAVWFSGHDLGLKVKNCLMSWSFEHQPIAVKVMQYEGGGLKALFDHPITGEDANLFNGDQVLWLEGDTVLGGARVVKCL